MCKYNRTATTGHSVDEPLDTVTAKYRFGLILATAHGQFRLDIRFRMLQPAELARAMGFEKYGFTGSREEQVKQIGNAVSIRTARAHCLAIRRASLSVSPLPTKWWLRNGFKGFDVLLPFTDDLVLTSAVDAEMAMLADRQYSRRKRGTNQFLYAGRKLVIRNYEGTILFGWLWELDGMRMDRQHGYCCCSISAMNHHGFLQISFSQPSASHSSIGGRTGCSHTWTRRRFAVVNPGHFVHRTRDGKHLLAKEPEG